jgi:hypothetical protein
MVKHIDPLRQDARDGAMRGQWRHKFIADIRRASAKLDPYIIGRVTEVLRPGDHADRTFQQIAAGDKVGLRHADVIELHQAAASDAIKVGRGTKSFRESVQNSPVGSFGANPSFR